MAVVGLEKTVYKVDESVGGVQVCAIVHSPNMSCPITFSFDIPVTTSNGNDIKFSTCSIGILDLTLDACTYVSAF